MEHSIGKSATALNALAKNLVAAEAAGQELLWVKHSSIGGARLISNTRKFAMVLFYVCELVVKHLQNPVTTRKKRAPARTHLESLSARHAGHFVLACTISVVISLEKLSAALDDAVHALADAHLLQKALPVHLGLLAQVPHTKVQLDCGC